MINGLGGQSITKSTSSFAHFTEENLRHSLSPTQSTRTSKKKVIITRYSKLSDVIESRKSIGKKKRVGEPLKTEEMQKKERGAEMALELNKQA